nr:hypothetical protein [Tanacetum cinerariifolium]
MLRDYNCCLKTYCCWYKLKLLDNAANSRLRLLEQSVAVDVKMKKYHYVSNTTTPSLHTDSDPETKKEDEM